MASITISEAEMDRFSDMIAQIHGVERTEQPEPGKFVYTKCCPIDDQTKNVTQITFSISRYEKYHEILQFEEPVTEKTAILRVEEFLSEPLTQKYYEKIQDDTFHEDSWDESLKWMKCRGDALTDAKYLEVIRRSGIEIIVLCGS